MIILMAGFGAIFGSILRFALLNLAPRVFGAASAWMVMVINLSAALLIGITFGLHLSELTNTFCATGILGGYSTFSAPIVELADSLSDPSQRWRAFWKTILAFIGGIPVLLIGMWLASVM
ncbi:MAG: CrcB family protein [Lactobacillaceae bacterium]|jgi:CrcB protein|nr:CrcB family protein [Lactobacillaceae bacterium]